MHLELTRQPTNAVHFINQRAPSSPHTYEDPSDAPSAKVKSIVISDNVLPS